MKQQKKKEEENKSNQIRWIVIEDWVSKNQVIQGTDLGNEIALSLVACIDIWK